MKSNEENKKAPANKKVLAQTTKFGKNNFDQNTMNTILGFLSTSDVYNLVGCSKSFSKPPIFSFWLNSSAQVIEKFKKDYKDYTGEVEIEDRGGELAKCLQLGWFRAAIIDDIVNNKKFMMMSIIIHSGKVPPKLSELFKQRYYSIAIQEGFIMEHMNLFDVTCRFEWLQKLFSVNDIGLRLMSHLWQLPSSKPPNVKISQDAYSFISKLFNLEFRTFKELDFTKFLECNNFDEVNNELDKQITAIPMINKNDYCLVL